MTTLTLTRWKVETSHCVAHPTEYIAHSFEDLRRQLREFANAKKIHVDRPPIGELLYKYELDKDDEVEVIHVSFISQRGKRLRFMRLRRK